MALTDSKLKSMQGKTHEGAPIKVSDRDGLYVYHLKSGTLSFKFRYKFAGKAQELTLGKYPFVSLAEAREKAIEYRSLLEHGKDPKVVQKLKKAELESVVTVEDALEHWIEKYAKKNRKNWAKHQAQFKKHIYPRVGELPVEQCDMKLWVKVFDEISDGKHTGKPLPKASGYILQNCKQALKFCRVRGFCSSRELDDLTISDIGEHQNKKDRVLSKTELMEVWEWAKSDRSSFYYGNLVNLLITFGCRTGELRVSTVSEWNLDEMVWTVPKEHSKTHQEIKRPIPESIKEQIQSLITQSKNGLLLGEFKEDTAVSAFGRSIHKKLKHKPWTLHDLRRTFATMLNDLEIAPYVVELMLGHSLGGVQAIYNRSQHMEQKEKALELWLSKLEETEHFGNVVGIK
ncbi:hypothetical protein BCS96_06610 [Vibrio breoganii]|uniref:tyrosine-type recombinase/integrase n=1 Tax=Vibrio breoganii TaxID=553239 RepID=UPI000C83AD0E|nr:site-specific integrase [Vibrio breoganii]PMG35298.1 hypothetical protein BCU93_17615 [Vibrio breoganii]PMG90783.1 hypothetical protein BCU81_05335 [Vibrio breoganii]PMH12896.1 hypothetical protein BCU74_16800 [Vibrio breoganii]PML80808.1 hypothetical protein BCT68_14775 [Vibrio breoganii]PML95879.1 hypothetical protein BCT64_01170 [Vibrio breoganii]